MKQINHSVKSPQVRFVKISTPQCSRVVTLVKSLFSPLIFSSCELCLGNHIFKNLLGKSLVVLFIYLVYPVLSRDLNDATRRSNNILNQKRRTAVVQHKMNLKFSTTGCRIVSYVCGDINAVGLVTVLFACQIFISNINSFDININICISTCNENMLYE